VQGRTPNLKVTRRNPNTSGRSLLVFLGKLKIWVNDLNRKWKRLYVYLETVHKNFSKLVFTAFQWFYVIVYTTKFYLYTQKQLRGVLLFKTQRIFFLKQCSQISYRNGRDPLEWSVFRLILLCPPTDQLLVRVIQRCTNSMSEGWSLLVAVK